MSEVARPKSSGNGLRWVLALSVAAALAGVFAGSLASGDRPETARAKGEDPVSAPAGSLGEGTPGAPPDEGGFLSAGAGLGSPDDGRPARAVGPVVPELAPAFSGLGTVTVFLVLLLAATLLLVKRGARRGAPNGQVRVVDTVPLGGRRMIHLVRCGDRRYLIGNSERGIHFLASVDSLAEPETPADSPTHDRERHDREGEPTFDDVFRVLGAGSR